MRTNSLKNIFHKILEDENLKGMFSYDDFRKNICKLKNPPWCNENDDKWVVDDDITEMEYYVQVNHEREANTSMIAKIFLLLGKRNRVHPLKDYLNALKWDGVSRMDTWLVDVCGCPDNAYTREAGSVFLLGAISRIYEAGCQFDYMLILEGEQGIGKSTLFRILGGEFYVDTSMGESENKKELVDICQGGWIVEIADMAGFKKSAVESIKRFISCLKDKVRLSYARRSQEYPRQSVFVGTHNPSGDNQYLKDDTGNRRFYPVECSKADVDLMAEIRDQLWAEALVRYHGYKQTGKKTKEYLCLNNPESLRILTEMHSDREPDSPIDLMLGEYVAGKPYVKSSDIFRDVYKVEIGRLSSQEIRSKYIHIGIFFKRQQWKKGVGSKRGYYFRPGHEHDYIIGFKVSEEAEQIASEGWQE